MFNNFTKIALFSFGGIGILILAVYIMLVIVPQGEFITYDDGITVEVNNKSNQPTPNLKFTLGYSENPDFQNIGVIKPLKSEKSEKLTNNIKTANADLSLYIEYKLKNGKTKKEDLFYSPAATPQKIVAKIDITEIDKNGKIKFNYKGYDGASTIEN